MRTARRHPQVGWLHLQGQDYSRSLDRLLLERDRLDDLTHSGPAPAYMAWVWAEELPALARQQHYRNQIHDHIADLEQQHTKLQQTIAQGRLDLEPAAGQCRAEIRRLQELLSAEVAA
jgi:hypothetical protein